MKKRVLQHEFRKPARKQRVDEAFDFDAEVARARREHPALLKNTHFMVIREDGVKMSPGMKKKLAADEDARDIVNYGKRWIRRNKYPAYYYAHPSFHFVELYEKKDRYRGFHPKSYAAGQKARAFFDHELTHALTWPRDLGKNPRLPWARRERLYEEAVAETFSLIRQFQRYGRKNKRINAKKLIAHRLADVLAGREEEIYYVSPALERVVELNKTFNFSSLTPRQTLSLARKIAREATPKDIRTVRKIKREAGRTSKFRG